MLDPITVSIPASALAGFLGWRFASQRHNGKRPDVAALHEATRALMTKLHEDTRENVRDALTTHQYQMDKSLMELRAAVRNDLDNLRRELQS